MLTADENHTMIPGMILVIRSMHTIPWARAIIYDKRCSLFSKNTWDVFFYTCKNKKQDTLNGSILAEKIKNPDLRNMADESTQNKTWSLAAEMNFLNTGPQQVS